MPTWPPTVPFFEDRSAAALSSPEDNLVRSSMSVGPAKVRRRSGAGVRRRSGRTHVISDAQRATFEAFFRDDLAEGAEAFDVVDPFDNAAVRCRFVGGYDLRVRGRGFVISAELERLP